MSNFSNRPTPYNRIPWRIDLALATIVALLFSTLFYNTPLRVGDGSEYYGLFLAIKNHHVPWMTSGAYDDYSLLYASNQIKGLVSADILRNTFPELNLGKTADFNHFWFYSLPPALFAKALELVGFKASIQSAFLAWHAMLLLIPMRLAYKARGALGVSVIIIFTICSPIIWFSDKVHTEFFTYSLALCTFILVYQRRYVAAAVCMAIAATQNPSFAILSLLLLLIRAFSLRTSKLEVKEIIGVISAGAIVFVHPLYYYSRFGVPTPQLLAGGAKIGGHWSDSYIWLLDPDLGLLPNWPLGLIIAIATLFFASKVKRNSILSPQAFFTIAYLAINLFAQSSTTTLNSGATPGLARYALWYIPVFYPFAVYLGSLLRAHTNKYLTAPILIGLIAYFGINAYVYDPRQPESYVTPSPLSLFLQTYTPSLYDPPPEVFVKRFSDTGDSTATRTLSAVVGPSCDKAFIFPSRDSKRISLPDHCLLSRDVIVTGLGDARLSSLEPRYIHIPGGGTPPTLLGTGSYYFREGDLGLGLLGPGWHKAESWGTWSKAPALLSVPCPSDNVNTFKVALTIRLFTPPQHPSTQLGIASGKDLLFGKTISGGPQDIEILVRRNSCNSKNRAILAITADRFLSPKELALSEDDRPLGIGLEKIHYPDR